MTEIQYEIITLGCGHRTLLYKFEQDGSGTALLHAFTESFHKRLAYDDKVKSLYHTVSILLSQGARIADALLTVEILSKPVGVYASPHGYASQIACHVALHAGLPLIRTDHEDSRILQIGIGDGSDGIQEYLLLKDILFWLPALI